MNAVENNVMTTAYKIRAAAIYHNGFIAAHDSICHQIYRCESRKFGGCEKFARRLGNRLCNSNVKVVVIGRCI